MAKKQKNANKKADYSVIVNIIFVLLFAGFMLFIYALIGMGNVKDKAEKIVNEKVNEKVQVPEKLKDEIKKEPKENGEIPMFAPPFKKYKYVITFDINVKDKISDLKLNIPVSTDEKDKQYITNTSVSIKPDRIYNDGPSTYYEYNFPSAQNQNIRITFEGIAKVRNYTIGTAKLLNKNISPEKDLTQYLIPEPYIESNDEYIKSIADKIKGDTKEEILKNIYIYGQKRIKYVLVPTIYGAKKAIKMRSGKCAEYAATMVALCRAKNIPARVVMGYFARKDNQQHDWVEVYFDEYGWVMYDPTAKPTVIRHKDTLGTVVKQEIRYDVNHDDINYIATGRNSFKSFEMNYNLVPGTKEEPPVVQRIINIEPVE